MSTSVVFTHPGCQRTRKRSRRQNSPSYFSSSDSFSSSGLWRSASRELLLMDAKESRVSAAASLGKEFQILAKQIEQRENVRAAPVLPG